MAGDVVGLGEAEGCGQEECEGLWGVDKGL